VLDPEYGIVSDYLPHLNNLADRSFNDLTPLYPVFPWAMVDYTFPTLSLDEEETL